MELWGFENSAFVGKSDGLFAIKGAGGGKGGAKATDLTPPPPIKLEEAEKQAPEGQGAVVAILKVPGKNKNIYSPGKEFRVPLFFAYKKNSKNENAKPETLDTKEEYEEVKQALEDNPYYKTYVSDWTAGNKNGPANPATVSIEYRSADNSKQEVALNAFENLPEAVKEPTNNSLNVWEENFTKRLDKIKDQNEKLDALIAELMAAIESGDTNMIARVVRLFAQKAGLEATKLASAMGEAFQKLGKQDKDINEKISDILRGKVTPESQATLNELRTQLTSNSDFKQSFMELVRDSLSRKDEAVRFGNDVSNRIEEINRSQASGR
jgi:hypothetical protein